MVLVYERHVALLQETLEQVAKYANNSLVMKQVNGTMPDGTTPPDEMTVLLAPRMAVLELGVMAAQLLECLEQAKCGYSDWYKRSPLTPAEKVTEITRGK
jgi:hypothetical protein